ARGPPRFAEVFRRQHVGGGLRPGRRHLDALGMEHPRAVGIADLAFGQAERDVRIGGLSFLGVSPRNPHHPPLRRWRGGPTDRRHVTRPAALASRPRSDWLVTLVSI